MLDTLKEIAIAFGGAVVGLVCCSIGAILFAIPCAAILLGLVWALMEITGLGQNAATIWVSGIGGLVCMTIAVYQQNQVHKRWMAGIMAEVDRKIAAENKEG